MFGICSLIASSPLAGQQFLEPRVPTPPLSVQQQAALQSMAHADAIRRQMLRAQRETGAPEGFARQAYQAQQAYAAQQAYESYLANRDPSSPGMPQLDFSEPGSSAVQANYVAYETTPSMVQAPVSYPVTPTVMQQPIAAPNYQQAVPQTMSPTRPTTTIRPATAQRIAEAHFSDQAPVETPTIPNSYSPPVHIQPDQQASPAARGTRSPVKVASYHPVRSASPSSRTQRAGLQDKIVQAMSRPVADQAAAQNQVAAQRQAAAQLPAPAQFQSRELPSMPEPNSDGVANGPKGILGERLERMQQQREQYVAQIRQTQQRRRQQSQRVAQAINHVESRPSARTTPDAMIQQTAMQEPLQDPFGDHPMPPAFQLPEAISNSTAPQPPRSPWVPQAAPLNHSRSTTGQQISILNRPEESFDEPDAFEYIQAPGDQEAVAPLEGLQGPETAISRPAMPVIEDPSDTAAGIESSVPELRNELRASNEPRSLLAREPAFQDEALDDDDERGLLERSCDEFRTQLLDNPIRDIALDISPLGSENRGENVARNWVDRNGNVVATGAIADIRRGYVVLDGGQKLSFARLSDADLAAVAEYWQLPTICLVGNRGSVTRCWAPQTFTWTASSLCHKPLFFENVQLERYGHSHGPIVQPVHSTVHFFTSLVSLPYQTAIYPANECQYALGYYRPGDCAPWLKDPVPISLAGMRRQALVTTGLSFIP